MFFEQWPGQMDWAVESLCRTMNVDPDLGVTDMSYKSGETAVIQAMSDSICNLTGIEDCRELANPAPPRSWQPTPRISGLRSSGVGATRKKARRLTYVIG